MTLLNINTASPDDLDAPIEYPVLPAGKHLFVVAKPMEVAPTSGENPKDMTKLEARCIDEDANKGMVVFENFLIIHEPATEKEATAKKIHDAKLAQFVASTGLVTMEQIKAGEQFDLDDLYERSFQAETKVVMENVYPEEIDERTGKPKKERRARIKQFLFKE